MKSRDIHLSKYWFEYSRSLNGGSDISTQALKNDWDDVLYVSPQVKGDFKAPTPQNYRKELRQRYVGTAYQYVPGVVEYRGYGTNPLNAAVDVQYGLDTYDPDVYDDALTKLYSKVRGDIDLSIDTFQARQTAALARKIITAISYVKRHPLGALRKSYEWCLHHPGRRTRFLKGPGSLWLEYTYGLKPTVQTIYDTLIELNRNFEPLRKVEVQASRVRRGAYTWPAYNPNLGKEVVKYESSTRVKISLKYKSSADSLVLLGNFSSLNPASIVWELTPFSFVADWFIDVGGYMRNLESASLYSPLFDSGFTTRTHKSMFDGTYTRRESAGGTITNVDMTGWSKYSQKNRERLGSFPLPRPPRFKIDLSSGRLLNAAALLTVFLGK